MSWFLAMAPACAVALALLAVLVRRGELREYAQRHAELAVARERGSHRARLQHPDVDLSRCIGCGSCVRACPEDGVLALLHGQAVVVHGARCVGHGLCAAACPTGAIALTLGDLSDRRDLPALSEELEAVGVPGLFIAGELSGFALVRTAVTHGAAVADAIARRRVAPIGDPDVADLLIVGAGPAGLACALRAAEHGLRSVTIEQADRVGGAVAAYPRRKLVMTQPMDLPLHGRLPRLTYRKEELVALWEDVARQAGLRVRTGVRMTELRRDGDGAFTVQTTAGAVRARHVCLALGRRGTPRKLGVPGEDLPKVAYSLLDAASYQGRHLLVVGGGDSAVEAALGLAEQPGNTVTLSYRKRAFFRLKARNEARVDQALHAGALRTLFESEVVAIEADRVYLRVGSNGTTRETVVPNDEVFVFAGGVPPFPVLADAGVSFDPADRPPPAPATERLGGLLAVLGLVLAGAAAMLVWALMHRAYYAVPAPVRPTLPAHALLRPGGPVGLSCGVAACVLIAWNLAYLVRRSARVGRRLPGSLRAWMDSHVLTGLFAFLCVAVHGGFVVRHTVGGHAFVALLVVVASGTVGRYLYAFVPRAANGAEMDLEALRTQLAGLSAEWERNGRGFGAHVRDRVDELLSAARWRAGLLPRLWALVRGQFALRRTVARVTREARQAGLSDADVRRLTRLTRRAYRLTLAVVHYEELRAVLASWRYVHRWLALALVLLALVHIGTAVRYGRLAWDALPLARAWGP